MFSCSGLISLLDSFSSLCFTKLINYDNIFVIGCAWSSWFFFVSIPFVSPLMDVIMPVENYTRELIWPVHANFIIFDRQNHFLKVSVHAAVACFSLMCIYIGQASTFAICVEFSCGLFDVVR